MKRTLITLAAGLVTVCGWASLAETSTRTRASDLRKSNGVRGRRVFPPERSSAVLYGDPKARACSHCGSKCRRVTASLRICMLDRKTLQSSAANSAGIGESRRSRRHGGPSRGKFFLDAQGRGSRCFRRRGLIVQINAMGLGISTT